MLKKNKMTIHEIKSKPLVALLFSSEKCAVCTSLHEKLGKILPEEFPETEYHFLKIEENKQLIPELFVFSVPVFLVFANGKEYIRKAGVFSLNETINEFKKIYGHITNNNNYY